MQDAVREAGARSRFLTYREALRNHLTTETWKSRADAFEQLLALALHGVVKDGRAKGEKEYFAVAVERVPQFVRAKTTARQGCGEIAQREIFGEGDRLEMMDPAAHCRAV